MFWTQDYCGVYHGRLTGSLETEREQKDHLLSQWRPWNTEHVFYDPEGRFALVHVKHFKDLVMEEGAFNLQVTG